MLADDDCNVPHPHPNPTPNPNQMLSKSEAYEPVIKKKRNMPGRFINKIESIKIFKINSKSKEKYALKRKMNTDLELEHLDHDFFTRQPQNGPLSNNSNDSDSSDSDQNKSAENDSFDLFEYVNISD
jgi:hypothetical protein